MNSYNITFFCAHLIVFLVQCSASYSERPVITTKLGQIRGVRADDGDYFMFMGIPYAQVNRNNPFGKAIPQEPFDDIFDAIDDSAICPQIEEFTNSIVGTLDCLHLNIYVPITATITNPKSVMVMIYGGGFTTGFAGRYIYGPKFLVRHDVILITLNYRLGPYGFMCLDIADVPGNEGLKDQLLAFRWIKENIQAFGGDPNKITAFGNSAGARSLDLHLSSIQEKVFDQVILQSGTALAPRYPAPNRIASLELASHLGFMTNSLHEAIRFLAQIEEALIINATSTLNLSFNPCIENKFEGVENLLVEDWFDAPIPKSNKMPILLGFTNDEMIVLLKSIILDKNMIRNNLDSGFDINHPDFEGMSELVHRFYMRDEEMSWEKVFNLIDFMSDFWFNHAHFRSIEKYLDSKAGDIFLYMFSYVGERNFARRRVNMTVGGAAHVDELGYLFDISFYETPNNEDQLLIDRFTTLFANFAKFGNPTPNTSELLPIKWKPIKNDSAYYYLDLDSELTLGNRPLHRRMTFWDLFYQANADIQKTAKRN